MGNHDVGRAFASLAETFWGMIPEGETPSKAATLKALDAFGERYRGADAEFDDEMFDHTTPLGRMVAIAFDMKPEEIGTPDNDFEGWYEGPYKRFSERYEFC